MKKRLFCTVLAALLVMGLLVFPAAAEEYSGSCGDNATWTFDPDTGTLTISGTGAITKTSYEAGFGKYNGQILHLVVEEGITTIGEGAFTRLYKLQSVQLADSVKVIKRMAFITCTNLSDIDLGTGVTTIEGMAFNLCENLKTVVLPASVQELVGEVFSDSALETVAIPEGVTELGNGTFRNTQLKKIYIPTSVTTIKYAVFRDCSTLTDVYYSGTQEQWEAINIDTTNDDPYRGNNEHLFAANIHFEHSHKFDGGTVTRQATCQQKGVKTYFCSDCPGAKQETFSGSHKWGSGKTTAATCTENGKTVYTCTVCKDTKQESITASGHSWDTGTTNADTTVTYKCEKCSDIKTEGTPVTPAEPTVPETTPAPSADATTPETTVPAPEQSEPAPAIPKKTFPWGIFIGVVVIAAGGAATTLFVLKKKKK